jgi:hypothetical protein
MLLLNDLVHLHLMSASLFSTSCINYCPLPQESSLNFLIWFDFTAYKKKIKKVSAKK